MLRNDFERLFIGLFAIYISSLMRCLLRSFAYFLIELFVFLFLSFKRSLNILDISHYQICFVDILSQSVACLFIFLTSIFAEQKFKKNFFINVFILFLAVLGLHCCMRAFSSCSEWELLFVAVRRLLIAVASLAAKHRLQACGIQQLWHTGSVVVAHGAQLLCGMWDLPRPGLEPMSPALADGFLTTVPPGKPRSFKFY